MNMNKSNPSAFKMAVMKASVIIYVNTKWVFGKFRLHFPCASQFNPCCSYTTTNVKLNFIVTW
ncbi:CLUMA_CG000324, isoform A [Clunio marinus]|uniref:CLUMA_CG000324, isoform A n=1 Tax=Clunio marinus TaxID=568069 RepID=A0A1J1HJK1_9DIPT|nr:CLUMA_CG000324, isoform A [Clunio marinus]